MPAVALVTEQLGISIVSAHGLPDSFLVDITLQAPAKGGSLSTIAPRATLKFQQQKSSCVLEGVPTVESGQIVVRFKLYQPAFCGKQRIGTACDVLKRDFAATNGCLKVPKELLVTPSRLPLAPKPRAAGSIRVVITRITDFASLTALNPPPRAFAYPSVKRLYFRVLDCDAVLGAIDYHTTTADVSLYITRPNTSLHLDLAHPLFTTKVARAEAKGRLPCLAGQDACLGRPQHYYEHAQVRGVPLDTTLGQLQLIICEKACQTAQTLDFVIRGHNWTGDLSWDDAARLTNVQLDRASRKVYMDVGHGAFLVLNYSRCSFELAVTTEAATDTAFDLVTNLAVEKVGHVVQGSQLELGQWQVQRRLEVRGAPADTCFVDVELCRYQLVPVLRGGQLHVNLGSLVALR